MAIVLKDRVKVSATTTGTGVITLGSAAVGFQSFAVVGDGSETYYTIAMQTGAPTGEFEVGIGTVTDTAGTFTLSRDTVLESSNAGNLVDFPAGTKDVFVTYPAERAVFLNSAGTSVEQLAFGAITATSVAMTTGTVSTAPSDPADIANKAYVDSVAQGLDAKASCVAATTADITLSGEQTIDDIAVIAGDRVLVKNQTLSQNNGIYLCATGAWTRAADADIFDELVSAFTFVETGTVNADSGFVCTASAGGTLGTTPLPFIQFSSAGSFTAGTGLTLDGSEFSITNTGTAGTFGSASQVPVFVTNAQGQVTAVTNTGIAITSAAVSGLAPSATTDTTNASNITSGTLPVDRLSGSYTGITGVGTLTAGVWSASTILANRGGTGFASYVVGDLLLADTTTSLAKLAGVAVGNALISGGVGSSPVYGKIGLATHVSGTLPVANGGTGLTSLGAGVATFLGTPSSANLAAAVTDETGSGALVFATSPTLVTPALGTPSSGNLANCTFPTLNQNTTGSAATLTTGRTIAITGDLTYSSGSFNGSANVTGTGTLANSGVAAGSYTVTSITVDAKGRVTAASSGTPPAAIPSGTVMLFVQTAAPTGFTKSTTHNNKSLRVVSGAAGSGGSVAFTTAFASQAVSGSIVNTTATGTVGNTALTIAQLASHTHTFSGTTSSPSVTLTGSFTASKPPSRTGIFTQQGDGLAGGAGGGQATASRYAINATHTHTVSGTTGGNGSGQTHTHTFTGTAHNHTFSGTAINLAVQYVDVIIATKD